MSEIISAKRLMGSAVAGCLLMGTVGCSLETSTEDEPVVMFVDDETLENSEYFTVKCDGTTREVYVALPKDTQNTQLDDSVIVCPQQNLEK